jgi:predicted ribosome quality control (RQC) complex YloA/Tae2 family protein
MQRQLSSFDIYVIVSELQELTESRIDKIYQLTRDELLIRVKNIATKQKESIFIRNGEFICLTQKQFDIPLKPTTFAMTLRKYLLNGIITSITQHEFDRIVKLNISKKEGEYMLIIEFFSDGNIILVDPNGNIVLPLIKQRWAHRTIKPHELYCPPPGRINPFTTTFEAFKELLETSKADLVRTLATTVSLSGAYAEEICARADIDKHIRINELSEVDFKKIFVALSEFLELLKNKEFSPVLIKQDGKTADLLPFAFKSYEKTDTERVENFARSLEKFIDVKKPKKQKPSKIEERIGKLQRQLMQQEETVEELQKKIEREKIEGDLIYLNFQQCEQLLQNINEVLQQK